MRFAIRVKPGSSRNRVGGNHDGALIVSVSARAIDGKATEAAFTLLARALGCKSSELRLVSGQTSRTKIIEAPDTVHEALRLLLDEAI
ncbi:MAG: DUF167 domain-containing protein [Microbacteriaceae bacterium]